MDLSNQRMHILDMIENGRITPDEGLNLLQILASGEAVEQLETAASDDVSLGFNRDNSPIMVEKDLNYSKVPQTPSAGSLPATDGFAPQPDLAPEIRKWKRWWMIPLWVGVAIAIFGGLFMYQAQMTSGFGFWFFCASVPFLLGLIIIGLAWQSRTAPWLHLRVRQRPGQRPERIAFSMPLPIRSAAWLMRVFKRWIPGMQNQDWEQMLYAVGRSTSPENPLFLQVDEAESGEKVEIYIG
jgi:hypothetical protein